MPAHELAASGFPAERKAWAFVATMARGSVRPQLSNTDASRTSFSGCPPILPPRLLNAATAISGPIPAGSPIVTRIAASAGAGLAGFDIGVAPEVAKIAPGQVRDLLIEQLFLDLLARGNGVGRDHRCALVASDHHLDAGRGEERRRCLAGPRLVDGVLYFRAQIGDLDSEFGEILDDHPMYLLRDLRQRVAAIDVIVDLNRDLHCIVLERLGRRRPERQEHA